MNGELFDALDALQKEKGISKEYMLGKIEFALQSAYKKENSGNENVKIVLDEQKKDMKVYSVRTVVETVENPITEILLDDAKAISKKFDIGDTVESEQKTKNFRRLSAQAAKQVIIQAIREAERSMIIDEYESKRDEIISAVVSKVDSLNGSVVLETGTSNAVLPKEEQIPGEELEVGQRIKVYVCKVRDKDAKGPLVTLSRIAPGLVKRLFELEIPEIHDGVVIIKSISREAGSRTKIAVMSRDENVDPVGSCIGEHRMRISGIVDELNGEKIDIVKFSEVPEEYIASALSPANVISVTIDGERTCRVIVAPEQLSLAIGKEGQNVRLAARLTGYKIDIKTD